MADIIDLAEGVAAEIGDATFQGDAIADSCNFSGGCHHQFMQLFQKNRKGIR